jgi:hypothetical protein
MSRVFRNRANRICVLIKGCGFVPTPTAGDDKPVIEIAPKKLHDMGVIFVEGKRRKVSLEKSSGGCLWLVDRGKA